MGAVGTSADNAAAESFFASLKRETVPDRRGRPTEQARQRSVATTTWCAFATHYADELAAAAAQNHGRTAA
ncbi:MULTISPECIES: hypothetical protein [Streptomyces]|uniref:hypothetical protein n=1 Tax=Streptomyces TaxID=1883 RepID=UPI001F48E982|nr:hypothetical protein [Streptomyces sp. A1-5]UJB39492.1 hypothetical protein HRD51_32430 [Streptomyces sp. A1-5]